MNRIDIWCPSCGTKLDASANEAQVTCAHCGATYSMSEVMRHRKPKGSNQPGNAIYEEVDGQSQQERKSNVQLQQKYGRPKRHLVLWILGWIFFFPAPLGVLLCRSLRKKGLNTGNAALVTTFAMTGLCVVFLGVLGVEYKSDSKNAEHEIVQESPSKDEDGSKKERKPAQQVKDEEALEYIDLQKGIRGEYGEDVVVYSKFVGMMPDIAYHVSPGNFKVKNCGIYPVEFDAYQGTIKGADGVTELGRLVQANYIESGETRNVKIRKGWVLAITSNTGHIALVPEESDISIDSIEMDDGVNVIGSCERQLKEYCYKLVADTYPNENVNWNIESWNWEFNVWDTDNSVDAKLDVPAADNTGYPHSVWILLTPITEGENMTGGTCHYISFDYIGHYTGDPVPEDHVYDEKGQPYRDRLDAIARDTLGIE